MSHADLTQQKEGEDLQTYKARIERELRLSKQIIDERLRQNTIFLAFPYGRYDETVLRMCERFGYEMAVSVKRGSRLRETVLITVALKYNQPNCSVLADWGFLEVVLNTLWL